MEDRRKILDQLIEEERENNSVVQYIESNQKKTILKLREIVVSGYIPSRNAEAYSYLTKFGKPTYSLINCLGHAVFNLKNAQIDEIGFNEIDRESLRTFRYFDYDSNDIIAKRMIHFIEETGLTVKPTQFKKILKNNQWRVALYFDKNPKSRDFHFFLQESPNHWTSKIGITQTITHNMNLGKVYKNYEFYDIYEITNPFAKTEDEKIKI